MAMATSMFMPRNDQGCPLGSVNPLVVTVKPCLLGGQVGGGAAAAANNVVASSACFIDVSPWLCRRPAWRVARRTRSCRRCLVDGFGEAKVGERTWWRAQEQRVSLRQIRQRTKIA